jgi:WD40 repeat protein
VKATFDQHKNEESGLIPADIVTQLMIKTDVFLTHDWGVDELGRANHDRVAAINKELKSLGFVTWFDSDKMTGDVVDQMVSGINNTSVVIVFLTQRYMTKVNGSNANDNCRKEFKYAAQTKSSTKMSPVVMEPRMKDINGNWTDLVKMELGNILYVDFSSEDDFQSAIRQLKAEILSRTNPLWVLKSEPAFVKPEASTPLLAKGEEDLHLIEPLRLWFVSLSINSSFARKYAERLVEKNTGSVTKLQRKLERNVNYLEDIGGFDEDDIIDIKEGLKLQTVVSGGKDSTSIEVTRNSSAASPSPHVMQKSEPRSHPLVSSESHSNYVFSLSWSSVSNKIASGSHDKTIKIWDGKSLELLKTLEGHSGWVNSVSWNHDGSQIVSGSQDKTIKIWDGTTGNVLHTLEDHSNLVLSVAWNHDSSKIVSGSYDNTVKLWDCGKSFSDSRMIWKLLKTLEGHSSSVYSVSWNQDGSKIVSGSNDKTIKIWDSSTGIVLRTLAGHSGVVMSVFWSHDDSKIVSGSYDKTVRIWNAITGDLVKTLEDHSKGVDCVTWSPDDRKIAFCSAGEKKIMIWDALTGQVVNTIQPVESVMSAAWSPDGGELCM